MRDIVSTIQAEQDAVIRLPLAGVVVIEGGPGTGKTAVALHRVAYLLYTHREQLARRGVLVVGPSGPFLDYVGGVLPSLGESAVVFTTPGTAPPRRRRHRGRRPRGRPAEGRPGDVRGAAQGGGGRADPARPSRSRSRSTPSTVEVDRTAATRARQAARDSGRPHNAARMVFAEGLVAQLVERGVDLITGGVLADPDDRDLDGVFEGDEYAPDPAESAAAIARDLADDLRDELVDHPGFRTVLNPLWPLRTPERLLADLLSSPARLAAVAAELRRDATRAGPEPSCTGPRAPPGRCRTRRCWTSSSSCSARSPAASPAAATASATPPRCSR